MALAPTPSSFYASLQPQAPPAPAVQEEKLTDALKNAVWRQLLTVELMMVVAAVMSCIMLFGSLRKSTSNAFFQNLMRANVVLTPMVISYGVGLMTNLQFDLFAIWGIILLVGMASFGTISAFNLEDNESAMAAWLQGTLKCSYLFGMLLRYDGKKIPSHLWWSLEILSIFLFFRVTDRVYSLVYASKTNLVKGVGSKVEIVAEYMDWDTKKTLQAEEEEEGNPKTMDGYRYLVNMKHLRNKEPSYSPPCYHRNFEKEMEDIVTVQDIWQCQGELLSSNGGDSDGRLKDTCLSFALFWMLLRRYIGYPLAEVSSLKGKTWKFVRHGLIPEISPETSERAFRVIEQELSFLYDYFYTKNFAVCSSGTWFMFMRVLFMLAFLMVAELILRNHKPSVLLEISGLLSPIKTDVIITRVVIYAMLSFELIVTTHYVLIMQWSRVEWVCTYVQKKLWRSQSWKDICLRWAIEYICRFPSNGILKWKREIDQYSLLRSHDYITRLYYLSYFILPLDMPKRGQKASKSVPFSMNLKIAVLSSLYTNGRQLTNGRTSSRKYGLETDLHWALNLETHTQTILVWHIATSFCELNHLNRYPRNLRSEYLSVATSLSEYCAYLVAFVPELLPDQTNTTFKIINYVISEANTMFHGCSSMESKYVKMMMTMTDQRQSAEDPILEKGIWLGKSLVSRMCTDESDEALWEMFGEFWAELLLYLAPSDDADSHIKHLANGGQLITHLWTLLTHAGILKRD
ncbi:hypothetical protein vseg_014117 [Gypsophila vaccaria]